MGFHEQDLRKAGRLEHGRPMSGRRQMRELFSWVGPNVDTCSRGHRHRRCEAERIKLLMPREKAERIKILHRVSSRAARRLSLQPCGRLTSD